MKELEIEVYKSLLEIKTLIGMPRNVAIYITLAFGTVLVLTENLIVIPLYIITCFICAIVSKKDPQFILIYASKVDRSNYFNS